MSLRPIGVLIVAIGAALSLVACSGEGEGELAGTDPVPVEAEAINFDVVSRVLLERLDLQAGERTLFVGAPGRFDPLVPRLRAGVTTAGAVDLGAWSVTGDTPESWSSDFTLELAGLSDDALVEALSDVDAAVMMPGANTSHAVYAALQDVLRTEHGRTVHFHWLGAYDLDGTERPIDAMVDAFYERVLVETDYAALGMAQRAFTDAMRGATVRVTTPAGTDIFFQIGDRPVTRQDGDASAARAARGRNLIDREVELPAGAIRVAPLEDTVNGTIAFPPSVWQGQRADGLVLTFEQGRVVSVDAASGQDAVLAEMDAAGDAGRAFREFALGFNPLLAIPADGDRWIPYYGYGAGVVRLSLGDNTELGGVVGGGYVRWNFFVDATVTVDDVEWVRDGRLVR